MTACGTPVLTAYTTEPPISSLYSPSPVAGISGRWNFGSGILMRAKNASSLYPHSTGMVPERVFTVHDFRT